MKKLKRAISMALIVGMLLTSTIVTSSSAATTGKVSGETSRTTKEITLANGTKTGVIHTNIKIGSYYGSNREIHIAEGNLSNKNLSLEFINSGSYMIKAQTMTQSAAVYNSNHKGETVVAAVNGDLYMTSVHSGSSVTKKVLGVPRGVLIIDGEIWASAQVDQENLGATNAEKGQPAGIKPAFGVTDLNQPVIGTPIITTTLEIGSKKITTDGINRLPAMDAIMVYNHRVNSSNYALNDSYEVEIAVDKSSAFKAGGTITGKIVNIYESGSTTRPSLASADTIVITARGSRINELKALCAKGKAVTLKTDLVDGYGNTELWQNVQDAIGGHMQVLYSNNGAPLNDNTYYPTTLIGYKDDGTVALLTFTSTKDNSRSALKISQSYELCRELGYNSVFYLDGGGSTTFVTLESGSYTVRNKCSDGSQRAVMGGIGFVWSETPNCMRQGSLYHISVAPDYSAISPVHLDGALIHNLTGAPNAVTLSYDENNKAFSMKAAAATNDPFATLDYTKLQAMDVKNYPYIVLKVKTNATKTKQMALYFACGSDTGPSEARVAKASVAASSGWQYVAINMGTNSAWSGKLNSIRLDLFNEAVAAGETMLVSSITLCKSSDEVNRVRGGWVPEGACENFKEHLDSLKPTPDFDIGDLTGDGSINVSDIFTIKFAILKGKYSSVGQRYAADINDDASVNLKDLFEVRFRILKGRWRY